MSNLKKGAVYFFLFGLVHAGCLQGKGVLAKSQTFEMISLSRSGKSITIDELYDYCKVPGHCGKIMECEGKFVLIKGYISYINVWDKKENPWLPFSKFLMYNADRSKNVEVKVDSPESDMIFRKIKAHSGNPDEPVYVKGQLMGVDLPAMGACHRDLIIILFDDQSISYGKCGKLDNVQ